MAVSGRAAMSTAVALAAVVALEYDDPVALPETRTRVNVIDDSDAFVAEMVWIIVKLEVVCRPDSRTLETDGGYFRFDDRVSRLEIRIRPLDKLELAGFRNRQYDVCLGHDTPLGL